MTTSWIMFFLFRYLNIRVPPPPSSCNYSYASSEFNDEDSDFDYDDDDVDAGNYENIVSVCRWLSWFTVAFMHTIFEHIYIYRFSCTIVFILYFCVAVYNNIHSFCVQSISNSQFDSLLKSQSVISFSLSIVTCPYGSISLALVLLYDQRYSWIRKDYRQRNQPKLSTKRTWLTLVIAHRHEDDRMMASIKGMLLTKSEVNVTELVFTEYAVGVTFPFKLHWYKITEGHSDLIVAVEEHNAVVIYIALTESRLFIRGYSEGRTRSNTVGKHTVSLCLAIWNMIIYRM